MSFHAANASMKNIPVSEHQFMIALDIFVLCISIIFFSAVFVFNVMALENNKQIAGQLAFFALLSQACVLIGDILPAIAILDIIVDMSIYWYAYNITFADTQFARFLTPISPLISRKVIDRYRWVLRFSISVTTALYLARIVGCLAPTPWFEWLAMVYHVYLE